MVWHDVRYTCVYIYEDKTGFTVLTLYVDDILFLSASKQGGFRLSAFSDANWDNTSDNDESTSSYIVMLANAPISFKVRLQGLTAQFTSAS